MFDPISISIISVVGASVATTVISLSLKAKVDKAKKHALIAKQQCDEEGNILPTGKFERSKSADYSIERYRKDVLKNEQEKLKKTLEEAKKLKSELDHTKAEAKKFKDDLDHSKEQCKELKSQIEVTKKEVLKTKKSFEISKVVSLSTDNEDSNAGHSNVTLKGKFSLSPSKFSAHIKSANKQKKLEAKENERLKIEKVKIDMHNDGDDTDASGAFSALSTEHGNYDMFNMSTITSESVFETTIII